MTSSSILLALCLLVAFIALSNAIGFPTGGGGGGGCCCCGGGGGGGCVSSCGCGRKKREVVMPHLKGSEVPCPQTEWRELMDQSIVPGDPIASLNAIQSALHGRFGDNKFLVNCANGQRQSAGEKEGSGTALAVEGEQKPDIVLPGNVQFSASGDGYCNVRKEAIWCQAIVMHA